MKLKTSLFYATIITLEHRWWPNALELIYFFIFNLTHNCYLNLFIVIIWKRLLLNI